MTSSDAPELDGVHHVKLPVSDLNRSRAWYESRLGYRVATEFTEDGALTGLALVHPRGGPMLALRLDPDLAARAAGFDYFSIGVPAKGAIQALAQRLAARTATRSASAPPSITPTRAPKRSGRSTTRSPPLPRASRFTSRRTANRRE